MIAFNLSFPKKELLFANINRERFLLLFLFLMLEA